MGDQVRLGALCWIASMEFLLAQFVTQLAAPSHEIFFHDISLLGISSCGVFLVATSGSTDVMCSPLHLVFNTGIVLHGALLILGVWLTRSVWPLDRLTSWALLLLALGGAGAMTVGAFPLDDHMTAHILGAVTAITAPGIAFLLLAYTLRHRAPAMARWTLLAGVVVLLSGLGHALGGLPFGRGTMERLAVWPQTIWLVGAGTLILGGDRSVWRLRPPAGMSARLWPSGTTARVVPSRQG